MPVRIVEKRDDLVFLARVQRTRMDLAALGLDVLYQRLELGAVAAPCEDREPFGRKFLGNLAANIVAGTDDCRGRLSLLQGPLLIRWFCGTRGLGRAIPAFGLSSGIRGPDPALSFKFFFRTCQSISKHMTARQFIFE